ncbi:unnamed protein product [Soboliphyme baturini]|uniref:ANK_REP_REGION domain-containing protein n=1 Tax=Soboliphyme baturini TaxID=241478 RepID=A0A183IS25_9BILA|nr:unnamed protein product [Soboliphyme baturini]
MDYHPSDADVEEMVTATQYGDFEYCKKQVSKGFDVNKRDRDDCTLLHWAAINNRVELVKYYIQQHAEVNAIGGELKSTPLHWAARQGHLKVVVILVTNHADLNLTDSEGCLAIHLAIQYDHTALVAYLISKGCSVNVCDRNGMALLSWATCSGSSSEIFQLLLAMGADVNLKDTTFGNTALHWAVLHNNHVAAALLVNSKADVSIRNYQVCQRLMIRFLFDLPRCS